MMLGQLMESATGGTRIDDLTFGPHSTRYRHLSFKFKFCAFTGPWRCGTDEALQLYYCLFKQQMFATLRKNSMRRREISTSHKKGV